MHKIIATFIFISTLVVNTSLQADQPDMTLQKSLLDTIQMLSTDHCPNPKDSWQGEPNLQCFELELLEQTLSDRFSQISQKLAIKEQELEKYGRKHLNLVKMAYVIEELQLPGVKVPLPRGLSSDEILSFLQTQEPDLLTHWTQLGLEYQLYKGSEPFLKTDSAKNHLTSIETSIQTAFASAASHEHAFSLPESLTHWLDQTQTAGQYLMVRSTGDEDNKELANAGGNYSAAYVTPARSDLLKAVGDVVKSYFHPTSLQNRLNADQNPFAKELKAPVTIQQLIGEPIGGEQDPSEIPISLVLFTNEPLYVGKEKFRVMRLSTTYGHGQGVVGNYGLATDTALLMHSDSQPDQLYVLYDNRAKPERLAPVFTPAGVALDKIANPSEIAKRPALSQSLLNRLYHIGVVMEKIFAQSTDMEIVIKGNLIYLVQARPVNRLPLLPTYLDRAKVAKLSASPILKQLQAEVVVPGKASVVRIDRPNQILYADTLENAERAFVRNQHHLVVVGKPEPANSHPVVNFSGLGIPCLYMNQEESLQALLTEITRLNPLLVCMQTGAMNLWDARLEDPNEFISQGFVLHPARLSLSTSKEHIPLSATALAQLPQQIGPLLERLHQATSPEQVTERLLELRQISVEPIQQAIAEVEARLASLQWIPLQAQRSLNALKEFHQNLEAAFAEAVALQTHISDERLRPLLKIKVIEEMLLGGSKAADGLGQYSLVDVASLKQSALELIDYQNALPTQATLADLLQVGHEAPNPDVFAKWRVSLLALEQAQIPQQDLEALRQFVTTLRQTGALPTWLILFFNEQAGSPEATLQTWLQSVPTADANLIHELEKQTHLIHQFQHRIEDFAQPDRFDAAWADLQTLMQTWSQPSGFWQGINNRAPLTQSMAIKTMNHLVDLFDTAIKKMKGNQALSDSAKVARFKQMLTELFGVFRAWGMQFLDGQIGVDVNGYLYGLKRILNFLSDTDPSQLSPSAAFNAAGAVINSGADFGYLSPETLEDVFTLLHQNLLAITTFLNNNLTTGIDLATTSLPSSFQQQFITISGRRNFKRIGFDISADGITARFNYPLRYHSGQTELRYDAASGQSTFKGAFFGIFPERWRAISDWANVLNHPELLPLKTNSQAKALGVTFTWLIDANNLDWALDEYKRMGDFTFASWTNLNNLFDEIYDNTRSLKTAEAAQKGFLEFPVRHTERPYRDFLDRQLTQRFHGEPSHTVTAMAHTSDHLLIAWTDLCTKLLQTPTTDIETYLNDTHGKLLIAEKRLIIDLATASLREPLFNIAQFTLTQLVDNPDHTQKGLELAIALLEQGHRIKPYILRVAANRLINGDVFERYTALKFFQSFSQKPVNRLLVRQALYDALSTSGSHYQSIVWILVLLFIS